MDKTNKYAYLNSKKNKAATKKRIIKKGDITKYCSINIIKDNITIGDLDFLVDLMKAVDGIELKINVPRQEIKRVFV